MSADKETQTTGHGTLITMVFELPLAKYDHVFIRDDGPALTHRYVGLDCGRLFPVSTVLETLHIWMTCPDRRLP
jgi:hypothetical protein